MVYETCPIALGGREGEKQTLKTKTIKKDEEATTLLIASLVMQSRSDNITNNKMYITSKQ